MSLDVHRVPSTTGQFDSGISQHVEVSSATRARWANQRHFRKNRETEKMNFQFGANLADQNVAAKNAKAISDGKYTPGTCSTVSQL